ncbi:YrhK family protein [Allosalinactinospora lopnorensis]|uniref:YrhK family protein n=1 Tax=Allosalinactinospora lopnorensis TaxID=1352348 RepID=UPI000623E5CA|nr:YrhK family protein [Allosalinactinospora lopnorensis]
MQRSGDNQPVTIKLGRHELIIRQRYEAISICNDICIAIWFIIGSILFFSPASTTLGTWFFLLGSVQLLIRPIIRFTRLVHLQRLQGIPPGTNGQSGQEF